MKITLIIISILALLFGCGGGSDSNPAVTTTAPVISSVKLTNPALFNDWPQYEFYIGDMVDVEMIANDPDLDMTTLYVTHYLSPDFDTPYLQTIEVTLPSQTTSRAKYVLINPIEVVGPAGTWKVCFMIVDSVGNESNNFCFDSIAVKTLF